jgi:tRNA(Ile)-lysidine synthase
LFQQAVSLHKKKLIIVNEESIQIPILKLQQAHPLDTIIFEIIKDYGFQFKQVSEVKKLLQSDTGKFITSDSHRILRNRAWLHISKLQDQQSSIIVIEPGQEKIPFDGKDMVIRQLPALGQILSTDQYIVQFDLKRIVFPLMLRKWKQGDYFYPLGMQKKKKVARFLIDQKLSLQQKEQTWVIESEKRIIWVVGLRIDDRFKIQPSTKDILQISLSTP